MAAQTLYLRSSASTVASAATSIKLLSTTIGGAATTGTSIKNAKTLATWAYIPGTASNTTTTTPPTTPSSTGWLFDGSAAGTYAAGTWTFNIATADTSATGTHILKAQLWVVTSTTTAVTQVTAVSGLLASASYTPSTTQTVKSFTGSLPSITLAAGQYLYLEVYLDQTVASGSATAVSTINLDAPSGAISDVATTSFTVAGTNHTSTLTGGLSFAGSIPARSIKKNLLTFGASLTSVTTGLNPSVYYRINETSGTVATDTQAFSNGTYVGLYNLNRAPLTGNDGGTTTFNNTNTGGTSTWMTTNIPTSAAFLSGANFSVSCWYRIDDTSGVNYTLVSNNYGVTSTPGFSLALSLGNANPSSFTVTATGNTGTQVAIPGGTTKGVVYHLVGVVDSTANLITLYLNGVAKATGAYRQPGAATDQVYIGTDHAFNSSGTDNFIGGIGEVAMFSTALTAAQVASIYNAANGVPPGLSFAGILNAVKGGAGTLYTSAQAATLSFVGAAAKQTARKYGGTSLTQVTTALNPKVYYRLNETTGTVATDTQGYSNGTYTKVLGTDYFLNQTPLTANDAGAYDSNQTGSYIATNLAANDPLVTGANFTVSAWVKFNALATGMGVVSNGQANFGGSGFALGIGGNSSSDATFDVAQASGANRKTATAAGVLATGKIYHLVGVVDSTALTVSLYVNGVLAQSTPFTVANPIGASTFSTQLANNAGNATNNNLYGELAECAIWPVALTATQIASLYNAAPNTPVNLATTGTIIKKTNRFLAAVLSFAGAFTAVKQTVGTLYTSAQAATLSFVGAITKATAAPQSANLSFVGAAAKQTARAISGALSFVGSISKQTTHALTAALSFVGAFVASHTFTRALTATLSFVGSQTKAASRSLTASLPSSGALAKRVSHALAGGLSFVGTFAKNASRLFAATLPSAGSVTKAVSRALTAASLAFSGAVATFKSSGAHNYTQALAATLSFTGSQTKQAARALSATLSFVGSQTKAISRSLSGGLSFVGSAAKRVARTLTAAALAFTGAVATVKSSGPQVYLQALAATLSFTGSQTKQLARGFAAGLGFAGAIAKITTQLLAGSLSFAGAIAQAHAHFLALTASLGSGGTVTRATTRGFNAALPSAGTLAKGVARSLAAGLGFVGGFVGGIAAALARAIGNGPFSGGSTGNG